MLEVIDIKGTTDGSGDAVVDSAEVVLGEILMVEVKGNFLTAGADLTLQPVDEELDGGDVLGESIVANGDVGATDGLGGADISYLYPRRFVEDAAGAALDVNDNEAGNQNVPVPFTVGGHKLRVTIANGGNVVDFLIRIITRKG